MADIRAYLTEHGLTAEEITALVGNEKAAKALTAALSKYDEGVTLSSSAKADLEKAHLAEKEAHEFYENTVTPAINKSAAEAMEARAEAAELAARNLELHKGGWEVPAPVLARSRRILGLPDDGSGDNAQKRDNDTGKYLSREDFTKEMQGTGETLVTLMAISNQYQDLYGTPYLTAEEDFVEAKQARKPFRDHVKSKYKFDDKRKEKTAAAEQARIAKIVGEKVAAEKAKLVEQYGANPETRAPLASKFDKIEKSREGAKDSWKTREGRAEARKSRLAKFENVVQ
jgi:hypothetical protein